MVNPLKNIQMKRTNKWMLLLYVGINNINIRILLYNYSKYFTSDKCKLSL